MRIDEQVAEIKRAHGDEQRTIAFFPVLAEIVRAVQGRFFCFHNSIDHIRPRRRNLHGDASELAFRQAVLQLLPTFATILAAIQTTARAAGFEEPRPAPELPHAGVENIRVLRIHRQGCAACCLVDVENFLPCFAAIRCLVHAAFIVIIPQMPEHANVNRVRVAWIDADAADALTVFQPHVLPGFATIRGFVYSIPDRDAVAHSVFSRTDPYRVRVRLINSQRSDRLCVFVKNRFERGAATGRFPQPAASGAHVDNARIAVDSLNSADAPTHHSRANRPRRDGAKSIFVQRNSRVFSCPGCQSG